MGEGEGCDGGAVVEGVRQSKVAGEPGFGGGVSEGVGVVGEGVRGGVAAEVESSKENDDPQLDIISSIGLGGGGGILNYPALCSDYYHPSLAVFTLCDSDRANVPIRRGTLMNHFPPL